MTLAGRNGAGKTTLLRMLAGQAAIDRGELSVAKGVRVALHDQRPPRERTMALREYVLSGCEEELRIESELAQLEAQMAAGEAGEQLLARYARAQARLEARGGYVWRERATAMARGLGFAEQDLERPLRSFSGGELTRASLARALATGADVLLLDEPTNHLDIASLEWLEQTLLGLDAGVVLVAHDRWFLEAVGTAVLALLVLPAAAAAEENDGRGYYGATNDKVITKAGFILILFFPILVTVLSLIQRRLDKRKAARKAAREAQLGHAQWRGGW